MSRLALNGWEPIGAIVSLRTASKRFRILPVKRTSDKMSGIKSLRGLATVLTRYVAARISKGIYTQKKTSSDVSQVQHLAHYTQQRAKHETPLVQSWCTWIETRHANPSPCIQENYMRMHKSFCLLSSKCSHILTLLQSLHTLSLVWGTHWSLLQEFRKNTVRDISDIWVSSGSLFWALGVLWVSFSLRSLSSYCQMNRW